MFRFACAVIALLPPLAALAAGPPDPAAVSAAQMALEDYHDVPSDISCAAPDIPAHQMMCEDEGLWQMGLLDSWAWLFAIESATGTEMDRNDPPLDEGFIEARDACGDRACLIAVLIGHTNASLGGSSPYVD